jgi:hypothetical protein
MAAIKGEKSRSWISLLIIVAILGGAGWFLGDLFFPVYRWLHVDFAVLAAEHKIPQHELETPRDVVIRYGKRGEDDPYPWQLIVNTEKETPNWVKDENGEKVNEYKTLVRVNLVGDRSGGNPRFMVPGRARQDQYYKAKAWRLPAKALGNTGTRFVLLIDENSMEKLGIDKAINLGNTIDSGLNRSPEDDSAWITDDDWPGREDGYVKPKRVIAEE